MIYILARDFDAVLLLQIRSEKKKKSFFGEKKKIFWKWFPVETNALLCRDKL